jgi:hypothetical protein
MKQQSLWEPTDGTDVRACWHALPEASRAEIIDHLVRLVVRAQLGAVNEEGTRAVSGRTVESPIADDDRKG